MELQVCNNYEKSDTICDKQCNFIIIILTIIYSTFISIIIFIKQPIIKEVPVEVIKEVHVEVIVEVIKEVPVEVIKEVIKEVPVEVIKEVIKEVPVEVIDKVVTEENNEEEFLLANYNTKERAIALHAAYEERAIIAIKKYGDAYEKVHNCGARWLYNQQFEMIDSQEHNKLINKNDISRFSDNSNAGDRYRFIQNLFREEYIKRYNELKTIARTEALNAMKKAKLFDDLFVRMYGF